MQNLFNFKKNIFSTNLISECAREYREIEQMKSLLPKEEQIFALNINLKA